MYSIQLSVDIDATQERVWRALCDPAEVIRWDAEVLEALDAPPDYPKPGQTVHWRCRDGSILIDRPQEVDGPRRLRSLLTLAAYEMDETYTLSDAGGLTRVEVSVKLTVRTPIIGALIERLHAGPAVRNGFRRSLDGLKRWCETDE